MKTIKSTKSIELIESSKIKKSIISINDNKENKSCTLFFD